MDSTKLMVLAFLSVFPLSLPVIAAPAKRQLIVYTYDSFISKWGPGPKLKSDFEATCSCEVHWVSAQDSAGILARLKIEGQMSKADVVVGLDDRLIGSRDAEVLFDDSGISIETTNLPYKAFKATKFIPFDYGFLAFMFNTKAKTPAGKPFAKPDSMEALLTNQDLRRSILIQDPRTSAPGMGLLLWLRSIYGSNTPKKLKELHQQTLSVSRGWSESYGFFTKGEAPLVLSYTTSEAYHRDAEKTDHYVALSFKEGHYTAVETAAIVTNSRNKDLGRQFLRFLLQEKSQINIAQANWMYPVIKIASGLPPSYAVLAKPKVALRITPDEISKNGDLWIKEWTSVFAR